MFSPHDQITGWRKETITLIKTERTLSHNLGREELREQIGAAMLQEGSAGILERTPLVLDPSDIAERYAEKTECLARVRDGSTGSLANGYWLGKVIGVENEGSVVVPLCRQSRRIGETMLGRRARVVDAAGRGLSKGLSQQ